MRRAIFIPVLAAFVALTTSVATAQAGRAADVPVKRAGTRVPAFTERVLTPEPMARAVKAVDDTDEDKDCPVAEPAPTTRPIRHVEFEEGGSCGKSEVFDSVCESCESSALDQAKELGERIGRSVDVALDHLFSGNTAELLSKNRTALLSGNRSSVLNGEKPKVLSENQTTVLSGNKAEGNTINLFSNIHLFTVKVDVHTQNRGRNCGNAHFNTGGKDKAAADVTASATANPVTIGPATCLTYNSTSVGSCAPNVSPPPLQPTPASSAAAAAGNGPACPSPTTANADSNYGGYPSTASPYGSANPYSPAPAVNLQNEVESLRRENEQLKGRLRDVSGQLREITKQIARLQKGRGSAAPTTASPPSAAAPHSGYTSGSTAAPVASP